MADDDDKKKRRDSWDDIFGDLDDFDDLRKRMDAIMEQFMRGQLTPWQEPMIYGFSMRVGPDGKPHVQEFGNATKPMVNSEEALREPLTDVIEEADKVRVIVELPGVEKDDIKLNTTENSLEIRVDTEHHRFSKEVELPCDVNPDSAKASYKNGVLEISLSRLKPKKHGKPVRIE